MTTKEATYQVRLGQWARLTKERGELGVSIRAYCAMKGFAENTYFYWQRRLRAAACEELGMKVAGRTSLPAVGFTEIRLAEAPAQPAIRGTVGADRLHIEVFGMQITADSGYPPEMLAALLRELTRS